MKVQIDAFSALCIVAQLGFFGIFLGTATYGGTPEQNSPTMWFYVRDISYMMLFGFGYLMSFLRKGGFMATGYTFLISALCVQWGILLIGFFENVEADVANVVDLASKDPAFGSHEWKDIHLSVRLLLEGLFAAITVLISTGAVIGVATPLQLVILGLAETIFYALNWWIVYYRLKVLDVGGSFVIHTFGCYFGLVVSRIMTPKNLDEGSNSADEKSTPQSDLFAMIGTFVLWISWPSFNSAIAPPDYAGLAVLNTWLGLLGGTVMVFVVSRMLGGGHRAAEEDHIESQDDSLKFDMVHIQNSTLAGAVAMGAVADLYLRPGWAIAIGMIAATVSVLGYVVLSPFLKQKFKLHDTCGIHNLHGMPGIIGCISSAIVCHAGKDAFYPPGGVEARFPWGSALKQGRYQWAGLGVTLAIAIGGGVITGVLMRLAPSGKGKYFQDKLDWVVNKPLVPRIGRKRRGSDDSVVSNHDHLTEQEMRSMDRNTANGGNHTAGGNPPSALPTLVVSNWDE